MLQLYALFNLKQKIYGRPMYFVDDAHAKHDITLYFSPKILQEIDALDYELFRIGTFDPENGLLKQDFQKITNCSKLVHKEKI